MKKLPSIYKNSVDVHNNLETFYSKNKANEKEKQEFSMVHQEKDSILTTVQEIFKNRTYSYTKKVRVTAYGKTYDTRFIQENYGKILTIDNEILDIADIDGLTILS